MLLFFNHESLVGDRWIALWGTLKYIYLSWIAGDWWQRWKAQPDAPETESWNGWTLRLHVFPSRGYPSVPFVLAFVVSKTDVPETDGPETDAPETAVSETKEGGDGERSRRMSPRRKVCCCCCCSFSTLWKALVDFTLWLSFSGVGLVMLTVVCVGGWMRRCVWNRVEERIAERPCFVVGYSFDYWIVWSLFVKLLWIFKKKNNLFYFNFISSDLFLFCVVVVF